MKEVSDAKILRIEGIANQLEETVREGDVILFKASRAVGLERVIAALKEKLCGEG